MRRLLTITSLLLFWGTYFSFGMAGAGVPFPDLPPGWTEHSWEGRPYYYNHVDGTSSWIHPSKIAQQPPPQAAPAPEVQSPPTIISPEEYPANLTSSTFQAEPQQPSNSTLMPNAQAMMHTHSNGPVAQNQEQESAALQNRLLQLEEEAQRLNEALTNALQAKENVEHDLDRTHQDFQAMAKQAEAAQKNAELVQQSLEDLESENEELLAESSLHLALQKNLTGKVEALETTKLRLEMQVFNLTTLYEATLDELGSLKAQDNTVQEELANAISKKDELEGLLEDALDEVAALDKERRQLTRWVQSSKRPSIFKRLFEDYVVGMVPESLRKPSPLELSIKEMNKTMETLQANNSLLVGMLESKDELIDELNERVDVFEHSAVKRKKKFKQLKEEISELTNTLMLKDEEIKRFKEETNMYYFEAAELNQTVLELQEKLDVMIDDNILMEEQIVDLNAKIASAESLSSGYLVQIDNLGNLLEQRLDAIDYLNDSLKNATALMKEAQKNASTLSLELERQSLANKILREEKKGEKKSNKNTPHSNKNLQSSPSNIQNSHLGLVQGSEPNATSGVLPNMNVTNSLNSTSSETTKVKRKWFCCF